MNSTSSNQGFVITAFWETKPGEEDSVAGLLRQFLPEARKEEGVKEFQIHQSVTKPQEFFFYEVFAAETAFAAHQQTEHFKKFILGEAIPKLARRERSQFQFIRAVSPAITKDAFGQQGRRRYSNRTPNFSR
jgi:quinol monooxygenase YgiN